MRRRVIHKQCAKVLGCAISRTRVIQQRVSLKSIVFSIKTPYWSPSEGFQLAAGNQRKNLEFTLALSKRSFSLIKGHCHAIWQLYKKLEGVFALFEIQN